MKLVARFTGPPERTRSIDVDLDDRAVSIDAEAAVYDVRHRADSWSILGPGGRHIEATIHREGDSQTIVHVGSRVYAFELQDELTARALATAGRGAAKKTGDVKASIPGRVVRILVLEGEFVLAGRPLVVLEAMKMENEVRSPRDGKVRSIEVDPGQAVATGDVLVRFEPEG